MNRSRVTSEFRELLDESGVEYALNGEETVVRHSGKIYRVWAYDDDRLAMSIAYLTPEQAIAATLGWIDEPDTIRNELADGGLIADALAPVCVDEKERRAFERGRVHERFAQQIFKEATS